MRRAIYTFILAAGIPLLVSDLAAQASSQPFKLGTFDSGGRTFVGAVLGDTLVIDLPAANAHLQRQSGWVTLPMARDMRELIGRYAFDGLRERIYGIVNEVNGRTRAGERLRYVHDLESLDILPPIDNPETMLNAAVNYRAHAEEMRNRPGNIGRTPRRCATVPATRRPPPPPTRPDPCRASGSARPTTTDRIRTCSSNRARPSSVTAMPFGCLPAASGSTGNASSPSSSAGPLPT
jgi:hypothetical protein